MTKRKRTDPRSLRTKHHLSAALVELIKEKRFDDITVQNVIDRAHVGRSTFYTHFRDKEDLFQKDWESFLEGLARNINWEKVGQGSFVPVSFLFGHLQDAQGFYQGLVRSRMTDSVFKSGTRHLSRQIAATLEARFKGKPSIPVPVLANYLTIELFALLRWWLDEGMPYTPERMDEMFHALVTP